MDFDIGSLDEDELRADLAAATDRALELADEIAMAISPTFGVNRAPLWRLMSLAAKYRTARAHERRLRRELKATVSG